MTDFASQIGLITGASSGIGAALAEELSGRGARLVLFARREDKLARVAERCSGRAVTVVGDVTNDQDRRRALAAALDAWGRVDLLINSAGLGGYGDLTDITEAQWRAMFEVNLFGLVFMTTAVVPEMRRRGRGSIVNVASIGGLVAHSDRVTPYVASKHAVVGFSRGLARDLAGDGIRVKAACPHLTDTEFFDRSAGAEAMAGEVEKYRSFMDTPQEVARGIVNGLDDDGLILFPTDKPARAFAKMRDI